MEVTNQTLVGHMLNISMNLQSDNPELCKHSCCDHCKQCRM